MSHVSFKGGKVFKGIKNKKKNSIKKYVMYVDKKMLLHQHLSCIKYDENHLWWVEKIFRLILR